jgi:sugar phosphate isomerase/epimerase
MIDEYYRPQSKELKEIDKMEKDFAIDKFGASTNPFQHQTEALKARIFHGANKVEFSFFGAGKSHEKQFTPGTFGRRERQDMLDLAGYNKVDTTTHATVGVQGLSGLNMQQGKFDDQMRKQAIDEIKRAIDFASDATTGGAVVFHSGEAPRYMHGRWKNGDAEFKMYPEEEKRKITYLADPLTKKLVGQISPIDKIAKPILQKDENGNVVYLKDENGNYVVDEQLKEVDRIHKGKIPLYETDKEGNIRTQLITFEEFQKEREKDYLKEYNRKPTEEEITKDFFYQQRFVDVMYSLYFGIGREKDYNKALEQRDKIVNALNFYKELKRKVSDEDWWKVKKEIRETRAEHAGLVPPDVVDPVKWLEEQLRANEREVAYIKELALHGRRTATEQLDIVKRAKLADKFAITQSAQSMADLGIYAWQKTNIAKENFKSGKRNYDLKKDIFIAPENLFPETYGSHPDELKNLVAQGRKAMADKLKSNYGMSEEEAKKIAKNHIKATVDIGHMNIWRKYFVSKPNESLEQRDKRFTKWLLKKTKELVDGGYVGHIHVNDNFGFHDEHLSAGDGNAPVKEFIEQAKKAGLEDFIVESGSLNPMRALPDTWAHFGSPVYHIHVPGVTRDTWTDFWHSYFGKTEKPRYIVGAYSPSKDFRGEPFYSGLDLEGLQYFEG